ncbi:MAG TPA: nickel-dependent hydrogenase large subunit [Candidatus Limnocylindrales bacterium]|jgi:Ni,Fe-hydrogenase I large subunit
MSRLVVDPVTRVNGQLRVEVDVDGGAVTDALASATMFRGLETVLRGRDPREVWLLANRICGTCTGVHGLASVRAVERALRVRIPANARILRNLLASTGLVRDHVLTFYQAGLPDWVDVTQALKADPSATARLGRSISDWPSSTTDAMTAARDRFAASAASGPGPFTSPWSGHPAYALSPEQSLLLLAHAVEALDWQRQLMRIHALLGGKDPHPQTYLVGGMALAPPWGGPTARSNRGHPEIPDRNAPNPLSADGLALLDASIGAAAAYVNGVYLPDVRLLAGAYREWGSIGAGPGNYLSWGDLPESDELDGPRYLPAGRLVGGNLARVNGADPDAVGESVIHAWYGDEVDAADLRVPAKGQTTPAFDAPLPLGQLSADGRYTWIKAARYDGQPMETGPLARVLIAHADGRDALTTPLGELLTALGRGVDVLPSVLGRTLARAVEAQAVIRRADSWVWELKSSLATGDVSVADITSWDPESWPQGADGWSVGEGPRGSVAHWVGIANKVVERYQVVDGSTWNLSPRDVLGTRGPLETALAGTPVADPTRPLEVLRVVHSFNPCPTCAVHAFDPDGTGPFDIRVHAAEGTR